MNDINEGSDMKKLLIILITILFVNDVYATNTDNISKVEYKWYKEEKIEETYYPKKDKLLGFNEDENQIKFGNYSEWNNKYCSYSKDYYSVEEKELNKYRKVINTRYIELEYNPRNIPHDSFKEIKIFYDNNIINYKIIKNDEYVIKIELEKEYDTEKLSFYIDIDSRYLIYLSNNIELTKLALGYLVMPQFDGKKIEINDNWIIKESTFVDELIIDEIDNSKLKYKIGKENSCRIREIYTYRYKIERKYYDDSYHVYVENYMPDIENIIIHYSKEDNELNNSKNFLENKESESIKEEESKKNNIEEKPKKNITNSIEKKENKKILKKSYIFLILALIIIILLIKIIKKNVD